MRDPLRLDTTPIPDSHLCDFVAPLRRKYGIDGRFDSRVKVYYKQGVLRAAVEAMRNHLITLDATDAEIAKACGVDRSAVTHWKNGGNISHENYCALELVLEVGDDELPDKDARRVSGFMEAVSRTRTEEMGQPHARSMTREEFECLSRVYRDFSSWCYAKAEEKKGEERRINALASAFIGEVRNIVSPPRSVLGRGDLEGVMGRWGEAWVLCVSALRGVE